MIYRYGVVRNRIERNFLVGVVFYSAVAAGLGCLWPITLRSGMSTFGVRFALGYATMVIFVYVAHILFGVSLGVTVAGLAGFTMAGFVLLLCRQDNRDDWQERFCHPAFLLMIFGATIIIVNGDIGYLPFTHDEFSHWLATPRLIHMSGSWAAVHDSLHLRFYTPGWQLTLLLPWQLSGKEDLGLSAAAPFVLHVTVIAFIYDFVLFQLRRRIKMSRFMSTLAAWAFVLLLLAAEGMGRLWTYTLLIEQPQIYSYTAVLLLIFAAEATGQDRKPLYAASGAILASAYLYKVAALIFVPAVIGLSCVMLFVWNKNISDRTRDSLLTAVLLAGPIMVITVSWSIVVDSNECSPLPRSADQLAHALSQDWKGLATRFGSAIWAYVIGYKLILTIAAGLGVVGSLFAGKYRATIVLILLTATYLILLYLYHLTCFGQYYFENLNSIERFTRVPLQMFHVLGLVMLFDVTLYFTARKIGVALGGPNQKVRRRWIIGTLVVFVIVLAGWQGRQVNRSVVDMTTRTIQGIDSRIVEMRAAAGRIESLSGTTLPKKPILTIISQGRDNAVVSYARFFGIGYDEGRVDPKFTVFGEVSWSPEPGNIWQTKASIDQVEHKLSQADIIWPIELDPWLMTVLGRLVPDVSCLNALPDKALVRQVDNGKFVRFKCIEK